MSDESTTIAELRRRVADLESALRQNEASRARRKREAARLIQAQKLEALSALAGGIAHEFNNSLNGISGNLELLKLDRPEDEAVQKYFEKMMTAVQRMAELTHKLVAYARGGKYRTEHVELSEFIEFAIPVLESGIDADIRIESDLTPTPLAVEADVTQLHMVFSALMWNAAEAIDGDGAIRIQTRSERVDPRMARRHPGLHPGDYACLIVSDTGNGMDETTQGRIFEPFFTTKLPGRGLGMAAAYGIIKSHGGWIGVDSRTGRGTRVSLYLPRIEPVEQLRWNRQLHLPLQQYAS